MNIGFTGMQPFVTATRTHDVPLSVAKTVLCKYARQGWRYATRQRDEYDQRMIEFTATIKQMPVTITVCQLMLMGNIRSMLNFNLMLNISISVNMLGYFYILKGCLFN